MDTKQSHSCKIHVQMMDYGKPLSDVTVCNSFCRRSGRLITLSSSNRLYKPTLLTQTNFCEMQFKGN